MPIYIYECPQCKKTTEVMKPIADSDKPEYCTEDGVELRMVPAVPGKFVWGRGGGWN